MVNEYNDVIVAAGAIAVASGDQINIKGSGLRAKLLIPELLMETAFEFRLPDKDLIFDTHMYIKAGNMAIKSESSPGLIPRSGVACGPKT
ncbi:hypothetical protein CCR75_006575 [Bremia lactucae]|uniref:Uncharacterized protein n=1 Tax=Bremia lactucae TaxID=4779 RepID=A0A976FHH1_BRELC|nr:hypothetical protein CCR75_006575 [Bremia lactucae]